ncbi:MAG: hypothetical protein IPK83_17245 [Planctomycetes bacterium]|nr:hypothetical protein [Planctomycetota bacterium]
MCLHRNLLYIADTMNHRIQVMEPNGRMAYQWGIHAFMPREGEGKLHYPAPSQWHPPEISRWSAKGSKTDARFST